MKTFLSILILISSLFLSCNKEITAPAFNHQYVINLVLDPETTIQEAKIDSTYRMDREVEYLGISGAEIFVVKEDSTTFRFREEFRGIYRSIDTNWVEYNTRYSVNIAVGNDTISESVKVPERLRILSPTIGDTVSFKNPPRLYWNNCESCDIYFVDVFEGYYNLGYLDSRCLATTDTFMNTFNDPKTIKSLNTRYLIAVTGYEENASNAIILDGNHDTIDDERAIGTIGSFVRDTITVWITE